MRKSIATLAALSLFAIAGTAGADECKYSAPRNADIDTAGLHALQVNLGSTDLHIQGVQGLNRIEVRGTACASSQDWLKDLQIQTNRQDDRAIVDARNKHNDIHISLFGSSYAYLKLQVRVPVALAVTIDSGSGDVNARSLASLDFRSGSGDLEARDIAGALALQLGSADAELDRVGSVNLHGTGSGDVNVDGVRGDVHADHSGSGDLEFSDVQGSVRVGSTGSGDVTLRSVGGSVNVGDTGSGDVLVNDVGGDLTVGSTGSGDVSYHGVKGKVSVPKDDD